tara:strand:- start:9338 stop:9754 length:417 start_codon:yes stop_codon:yes gene_type:complete
MNLFKWFSNHPDKVGFEDVKKAISNHSYTLINTMDTGFQDCLIQSTIPIHQEENIINNWMRKNDFSSRTLIIYGKNASDNSVFDKYTQLKQIGFSNIYIYSGGLFEWLLLQDIYGSADFPTTKQNVDLLKYREPQILF